MRRKNSILKEVYFDPMHTMVSFQQISPKVTVRDLFRNLNLHTTSMWTKYGQSAPSNYKYMWEFPYWKNPTCSDQLTKCRTHWSNRWIIFAIWWAIFSTSSFTHVQKPLYLGQVFVSLEPNPKTLSMKQRYTLSASQYNINTHRLIQIYANGE